MPKKRCCSTCHKEGHNSRTCKVRDPLDDNPAPEVTSADNHSGGLQLNLTLGRGWSTDGLASSQQPQPPELAPASNNNSREVQINKDVRWTPEEHLGFLRGIRILGKGAWKAISKGYVRTRTANQISSHAQKYFKRMKNPLRSKRNLSIFDVGRDEKSHQHSLHTTTLQNKPPSPSSAKQSTSSSPAFAKPRSKGTAGTWRYAN